MRLKKGTERWIKFHEAGSKKKTVEANKRIAKELVKFFGDCPIEEITPEQILDFLNSLCEGLKPSTKKTRYNQLSSFFNFIGKHYDKGLTNPCSLPMVRESYRFRLTLTWEIIEKDFIDEIIYRTKKMRNRLMMELMARGGMRISEVLKLRKKDIKGRKLILVEPKSGKDFEVAFIPQKISDRLREYSSKVCCSADDRVFPISYKASYNMVVKGGNMIGIRLRPHDLRRHCATYASRCGVPIEIISKIILRHANISTTQLYLGTVSDMEATKWIENTYG